MHQTDFDQNIIPSKIAAQRFVYTTKITDTYRWELEFTADGLLYKDLSGEYHGRVAEEEIQSLADFWFHGPLLPLPQRAMREMVLDLIRRAFRDPNAPAIGAHFPLFDYPQTNGALHWTFGDHVASTFVIVRDHGVDRGAQNWHDGLVYLDFVSFERCLTQAQWAQEQLGISVWEAIVAHVQGRTASAPEAAPARPERKDDPAPVRSAATFSMQVPTDAPVRATAAPAQPRPPRENPALERHERALARWAAGDEAGVELLLGLLEEKMDADYWHDIVFNNLFKMRQSAVARAFILRCLRGERTGYFKKAVDVLQMWALYGELGLADHTLWAALQPDKAGEKAFREAVDRVAHVLAG